MLDRFVIVKLEPLDAPGGFLVRGFHEPRGLGDDCLCRHATAAERVRWEVDDVFDRRGAELLAAAREGRL